MALEQSTFQFTNPILLGLNFTLNRQYDSTEDVPIKTDFNVQIHKHNEKREAIVELTLDIGEQTNQAPFFISVTEGAKFTWNELADSRIEYLLSNNAPALLLGYIRPIVATVTSSSPYETYHIPFIDFTKANTKEVE